MLLALKRTQLMLEEYPGLDKLHVAGEEEFSAASADRSRNYPYHLDLNWDEHLHQFLFGRYMYSVAVELEV